MKSVLRSIKHFFNNLYEMNLKRKKINIDSLEDSVLVMLAADYKNLGDVAITLAQKQFLENTFPNKKIIEIEAKDTVKVFWNMKNKITKNTIITLIGGGNTGEKYELIERYRRFIIRNFKKNKIVIFPQTIDFSNTKYGRYSLNRSIKDYSKNKNMIICARESKSKKIYKEKFANKIILIPDIVFNLKYENVLKREGIILMLRDDKEKSLNNNDKEILINRLKENYDKVLISDTCISDYNNKKKYELLFNKIDEIASKKLVITDRLHGMIFCYITKTPCIVIPNSNHKIIMTYENWLKDCNYIKLIKKFSIEEIMESIKMLQMLNEYKVSNIISEKHNEFSNLLKNFSEENI